MINAAARGFIEHAQMLLECGAAINARGMLGRTSLHWAAHNGNTKVVRFLLEHGADAHIRDELGKTPSKLASIKGIKRS